MERTKRLVAIIAAGALLFGCGDPGPEAEPTDAVPSDNPNQPVDPDQRVEEVDYHGFTVAPPVILEDGTPKHPFDEKLNELVETTEVPSTLAGAFFQLGRAYLSGREPITQLEVDAFEIFDSAPSETLQALDRTLQRIDELPTEDMATIYDANFLYAGADRALTGDRLGKALTEELHRRASAIQHGDPNIPIDQERAGVLRVGRCFVEEPSDHDPGHCPNICGVKTEDMGEAPAVRTATFYPWLSPNDYLPREKGSGATGNCFGQRVGDQDNGVCLRVPAARHDEIVRLEGVNFHDVDAKIELIPDKGTGEETSIVEVEAHVRGAAPTALERHRWSVFVPDEDYSTAILFPGDGNVSPETPPATCATQDVMLFQVPGEHDIMPGIYKIRVTTKHPNPGKRDQVSNQNAEPFIQILSPETTDFTVTAESLVTTWDSDWGREEIALRFYLLSKGEIGMSEIELGAVEKDQHYCIGETNDEGDCTPATLFSTSNKEKPVGLEKRSGFGIAFAIVGLEIDDRDAYEKNIRDWDTLYAMVSKSIYGKVADYVGKAVGQGITSYTGSKFAGELIGKATTDAIKAAVTTWAPADVIIADRSAYSFSELDALTSTLAPTPEPYGYNVADEVDVWVEACTNREERNYRAECHDEAKGPDVYREIREYDVGFYDKCKTEFCYPEELFGDLHWLNLRFDRIE